MSFSEKTSTNGDVADPPSSTASTSFSQTLPDVQECVARYSDEESAIKFFEDRRWPDGVRCPHCGAADVVRGFNPARRRQLWYCHSATCGKMFSVTSGTIMEATKAPLRSWLFAFAYLKHAKAQTTRQLAVVMGVSYETAWTVRRKIELHEKDPAARMTVYETKACDRSAIVSHKPEESFRNEEVIIAGEAVPIGQLADVSGVPAHVIARRVRKGESAESAVWSHGKRGCRKCGGDHAASKCETFR